VKVSLQIAGLDEINTSLRQLKAATARNVVKRALTNAVKPVRDRAQANAPVATGQLRSSISIVGGFVNNTGKAEYAAVLRKGGSKEEARSALRDARRNAGGSGRTIRVQVVASARYSSLVEFGTKKAAAQPFMRPAFDATKELVIASLGNEIRSEIEKSVARSAKRAAKLTAKG